MFRRSVAFLDGKLFEFICFLPQDVLLPWDNVSRFGLVCLMGVCEDGFRCFFVVSFGL